MKDREVVKVHDRLFRKIISYETLLERVQEISTQISIDYKGKRPIFLPVLNGSFMFASDLMRMLQYPCEIEFINARSYHGTKSSGLVEVETFFRQSLTDRHLVILEDIVDTGLTMKTLLERLAQENPASIAIASVLVKPGALTVDIKIDYACFEIANDFVVGYGLDYDGLGRNLPGIYQEFTEET